MNHQKDLSEFKKYHKRHKLAEEEHAELVDKDYKAANQLRFKSYKEFRDYENNKDRQREEINNIIEEMVIIKSIVAIWGKFFINTFNQFGTYLFIIIGCFNHFP